MSMISPEYAAAIEAHNAAQHKFYAVRDAYRALKVGDVEFLAARQEYAAATALYDEAFAAEAEQSQDDADFTAENLEG